MTKLEDNDFISIWLEETGNPAIEELAQRNKILAQKTTEVIAQNKLDVSALAVSLDINPEEIQRWLHSRHTFSQKVLSEIADLVNL